jgi:hypothetical protein
LQVLLAFGTSFFCCASGQGAIATRQQGAMVRGYELKEADAM